MGLWLLVVVEAAEGPAPVVSRRGSWPTYPRGLAEEVALSGDGLAYLACGSGGLQIVDVSDPSKPRTLAGIRTPGFAQNIEAFGRLAIVGWNEATRWGLGFTQVDAGGTPREVGQYLGRGMLDDLAVSGDRLYATVSDVEPQDADLLMFLLSGTSVPALTAWANLGGFNYAGTLAIAEDRALLGLGGFYQVRLDPLGDPLPWGAFYTSLGDTIGLEVDGSFAYLALRRNIAFDPATAAFEVVDLTGQQPFVRTGLYETAGWAEGLAVSGALGCFLSGYWDPSTETWRDTSVVLDLSNRAQPVPFAPLDAGTPLRAVALRDRWAYLAGPYVGLMIVDLEDPRQPQPRSRHETGGWFRNVAVVGDYAYAVQSHYEPCEFGPARRGWLFILDVRDPDVPRPVGELETAGEPCDVAVAGAYAYLAEHNGLEIIDVSRPEAPQLAGRCPYAASGASDQAITLREPFAYVACQAGDPGTNGLLVFDVGDPRQPRLILQREGTGTYTDLWLTDHELWMVNSGHLTVLGVQDPAQPIAHGRYASDFGGSSRAICVAGRYAYHLVSDEWWQESASNRLEVLDVNDPTHPERLGVRDAEGEAWDLVVSGSWAYVAAGRRGIQLVDISDPAHPTQRAEYASRGKAMGLVSVGSRLLVADGDHGLTVFDIGPPLNPRFSVPTLTAAGLTLSWVGGEGWILERTGSLTTPHWEAIDVSGIPGTVTVPLTGSAGFYRLAGR